MGDEGRGGPQHDRQDNREGPDHGRGGDRGPQRQDGRPPRDFGPIRQSIRENHDHFRRGAAPPRGIHLERGRPLPRGYYGERLDNRALSHLPYYRGYEWRRMGNDVFLLEVGSGIVYEILHGVLY
jgi:Ni/Co efflux regulator RcnB